MGSSKPDLTTDTHHHRDVVKIDSACIAIIDGKFFLAVEIEVEAPGVDIQPVIFISITEKQAGKLLKEGIKKCRIIDEDPWKLEEKIKFKCTLVLLLKHNVQK